MSVSWTGRFPSRLGCTADQYGNWTARVRKRM